MLVVFPSALPAQQQGDPQTSKFLHDFVQQFYRWYVPEALSDHHGPAWDLALKDKGDEFSPNLLQALKGDSDAQAKASGYIVGLDFDPF